MAAILNLPRFKMIKNRVNDLFTNCGEKIRKRKTVWCAAIIFTEMEFLVGELKRLAGGGKWMQGAEAERYIKIKRFVERTCIEQADVIQGGQIIKISAEVFTAMRFLVRAVETVYLKSVDDDVAADIMGVRLLDENSDRVSIDLDAGVSDEDDEEDEPLGSAINDLGVGADIGDGIGDKEPVMTSRSGAVSNTVTAPTRGTASGLGDFIGLTGSKDSDLPGDAPPG